jgi:transcriptional regulator with XRE-family HTH domain
MTVSDNKVLRSAASLTQSSMQSAIASIVQGIQADTGESDQDTADRLGVSAGTIANARNKRGAMSTMTLLRIGKEYGIERLQPVMHLVGAKSVPEIAVCTTDHEMPIGAAKGQLFLAQALADQRIDDVEVADGADAIEAGGQVFDALRWRLNELRATGTINTKMGGVALN